MIDRIRQGGPAVIDRIRRGGPAVIDRIRQARQPIVCLDFSRDQLTALEVADGIVTRWGSQPLPPEVLRNGDPIVPAALGEAVRHSLARAGIRAVQARMALPDEATVSRQLMLSPMPRRHMVRAMHFLAEKHIPFPIARARWSWDVVERTPGGVVIYLVAAWRDVVERYVDMARIAGLVPMVLEPRALAMARALDQDHALVVDAGARRLQATLLLRGQPAFIDESNIGSGPLDRQEALDQMMQRAYRYQSLSGVMAGRLAPVLLAGELEWSDIELPVGGRPVGEVLNGQLPLAPKAFCPGSYLANLGLSMRSTR